MNPDRLNVRILAGLFVDVSDIDLEVKFIVSFALLVDKRDAEEIFCKPRRVG